MVVAAAVVVAGGCWVDLLELAVSEEGSCHEATQPAMARRRALLLPLPLLVLSLVSVWSLLCSCTVSSAETGAPPSSSSSTDVAIVLLPSFQPTPTSLASAFTPDEVQRLKLLVESIELEYSGDQSARLALVVVSQVSGAKLHC